MYIITIITIMIIIIQKVVVDKSSLPTPRKALPSRQAGAPIMNK